jgi:hypothetical protein
MFNDYISWIQLQKTAGGLPANVFGYFAMLLVKLFALRDLRNPSAVLPSAPIGKHLSQQDIPARPERPKMHRWPVPQRQANFHPSASEFDLLRSHLEAFISRLADDGTVIRKGKAFDSLDAYFLNSFELFHIHPVDKSFHIVLNPSDAKLLVEKGWAEWFGLAGKVGQAQGTVFVYTAREEDELKVLERIWKAAVMFAKERKK